MPIVIDPKDQQKAYDQYWEMLKYRDRRRAEKPPPTEKMLEALMKYHYPLGYKVLEQERQNDRDRAKLVEQENRKENSGVGKDRADESYRIQQQKDRAAATARQQARGFENPPFDTRIRRYMPGIQGPTSTGYIEQADFMASALGLVRPYKVRFLYNPESLSVGYAANDAVLPPEVQSSEMNAAQALISNMQSIGFSLFFDRTYELNSPNVPMSDVYKKQLEQGVYADIAALERVVGIYDGQGPILKMPMRLYFGPRYAGPAVQKGRPLAYFGYINSLSVVYSLFTKDMVPVRAQVSVGFTQMMQSKDAPHGYIQPTDGSVPITTVGATE